jgi:photosystem II stability/assembly factor-like uncharacterized protein
VLAILGLLAGAALAKGEITARRELALARRQSPSLGVAAIYNVVRCGTYCKSYTPHIFVTGDGRSWREVTPPHLLLEVEAVAFSTPRGWVVANDCAAARAFFYRTRNGGRAWRRTPVPVTNCAAGSRLDVSFADTRHGWILLVAGNSSRGPVLYRTQNGGKTWRPVGEEAPIAGAIAFATPRIGWLARSDFALPGELYWTRDAGRSWHRRRLHLPHGWRGARGFPDRATFFGARGVLPVDLVRGRQSAVAFYTTANDGGTWRLRAVRRVEFSILARSSEGDSIRYVPTSIATPASWWIVGGRNHGHVSVTRDAGASWQVAAAPVVGSQISAVDARRAWLSTTGRQGTLYATNNGGGTWRQLGLP